MLRATVFLILIGLIACAGREVRDPQKAHLHFKIGTGYLNNGRYPEALGELLMSRKLNPDDPLTHNSLGLAYFVRKKYSEAQESFRTAIELNPQYTEARNNLGRVLIEMGLNAQAVKQLKVAVEDLTYGYPERSMSNLGIAYFRLGNYASANEYLGESLKIRNDHCVTSNYFARTLFEKKSYKQAAIAFDQAANHCKKEKIDEPTYFGALTYFKLKKLEDAQARFEEVIKDYPEGYYSKQAKRMLSIIKKN